MMKIIWIEEVKLETINLNIKPFGLVEFLYQSVTEYNATTHKLPCKCNQHKNDINIIRFYNRDWRMKEIEQHAYEGHS